MTRISILLSSLLFAGSLFADSAQVDFFAAVQNPLSATIAVTNHGPDIARNSAITVDIPPVVVQRLTGTEGDCVESMPDRATSELSNAIFTGRGWLWPPSGVGGDAQYLN
jgi:hypothetical protein